MLTGIGSGGDGLSPSWLGWYFVGACSQDSPVKTPPQGEVNMTLDLNSDAKELHLPFRLRSHYSTEGGRGACRAGKLLWCMAYYLSQTATT